MLFIVVLLIVAAIVFFYFRHCKNFIKREFKRCNVIVFGKKGSGKDLLFSWVIKARKSKHYSNILYDKNTEIKSLSDFSVSPNTYQNLIDGDYKVIEKKLEEKTDFYISDGGIIIPSQYNGILDKQFPSFPVFYALSRHLYNSNIHINTQNLNRVWNKLREQADAYFKCVSTAVIGRTALTKVIYYEKYESANNGLLPFKCGFFASKEKRALQQDFTAKNGTVKTLYLIQRLPKRGKGYDTRIYHKFLFGYDAPHRLKRKK